MKANHTRANLHGVGEREIHHHHLGGLQHKQTAVVVSFLLRCILHHFQLPLVLLE